MLTAAGWGAVAGWVVEVPIGGLLQVPAMLESGVAGLLGWGLYLLVGAMVGAVIGVVVATGQGGPAVAASGGVLVGLLGWLVVSLTVEPLLAGRAPSWSAAAAAVAYRELVADVLHGGAAGALLYVLLSRRPGRPRGAPARVHQRIVIVGGGFAGLGAARRFERLALRGAPVDVTVLSASNSLLFTPMLAGVASGALEPTHVSAPVRAVAAYTRFRHGVVDEIDVTGRAVRLDGVEWIPYDHLVLAAGSVPSFPELPGVAERALTLKDLADATRLRNRVIRLLERADDARLQRHERVALLTVVVAGGGFAGTELIAELFDLVNGVLPRYPGVGPDEPRFVLVHSGDRILPELSAELGDYALDRLRARGVDVRLGVRVVAASEGEVLLGDGARISAATFVWTAGNRPNPLVAGVGRVTDPQFRVLGADRVWAVGDCAQVPDVDRGGAPFPPTAQHAQRQGRHVADNIVAVLAGRAPAPFRFRTVGVLVALGHRSAAAEIRGRRFSGLLAWLLWRGIYLAKLPGIDKRARVAVDWVLDLVFPRDVVLTDRPADRSADRR